MVVLAVDMGWVAVVCGFLFSFVFFAFLLFLSVVGFFGLLDVCVCAVVHLEGALVLDR